MFAFS
jgi:hypothetical protein